MNAVNLIFLILNSGDFELGLDIDLEELELEELAEEIQNFEGFEDLDFDFDHDIERLAEILEEIELDELQDSLDDLIGDGEDDDLSESDDEDQSIESYDIE